MWCPDDTTLDRDMCFIDPHESEPVTSALASARPTVNSPARWATHFVRLVEASSKPGAEEEAARLGFDDAWAYPITVEQAIKATWLRQRLHRQHIHQHSAAG